MPGLPGNTMHESSRAEWHQSCGSGAFPIKIKRWNPEGAGYLTGFLYNGGYDGL